MRSRLALGVLLVMIGWFGMRSLCTSSPEAERLAAVSAILTELAIPHEKDIKGINAACQQHLLRKPGVERWQIESDYEAHRAALMPYLEKLGMCKEMKLTTDLASYDYVIFLGATSQRTLGRIAYVKDALLALPVKDKPLVILLGGMRPLDAAIEDLSYGATEAEMMENVYKSLGLGSHAYMLINAPMRGNARPTTDDTVHAWLATNPKPGRCLVVSCQPFVQRQTDVLRALLPAAFTLDAVGDAAPEGYAMAIYLDELARTVYQAKLVAEKNKK